MASQSLSLLTGRRAIVAARCLHTTAAVSWQRGSTASGCVPAGCPLVKPATASPIVFAFHHAIRHSSSASSSTTESTTDTESTTTRQDTSPPPPEDNSSGNTQDSEAGDSASADQGHEWKRKLLDRALEYVPMHGWHLACVEKAAQELELSPAVVGMLENGVADLVLHFERKCNEDLVQSVRDWKAQMEEEGERVGTTKIIREALRRRLEMIIPHLHSWHEALALFTQPTVAPLAVELLLHLVDDIWYLAGDQSTDFNWYTKRATLAAVYGTTELFMLQDRSAGNEETWQFLDRRLADVGQIGSLQATIKQALSTAAELGVVSLSTAQKLSRTVPPMGSDSWNRIFPGGPGR